MVVVKVPTLQYIAELRLAHWTVEEHEVGTVSHRQWQSLLQQLDGGAWGAESKAILDRIVKYYSHKLTPRIVDALLPSGSKTLCLSKCPLLTNECLNKLIKRCTHLLNLDLSGNDQFDFCQIQLFDMSSPVKFSTITSVCLEDCQGVSDQVIQALLQNASSLISLNIAHSDITDSVFLLNETRQLAREGGYQIPTLTDKYDAQLQSVDVSRCSGFTSTGVRHLCTLCGHTLRDVNLSWTKIDAIALLYLSGFGFKSAIRFHLYALRPPDPMVRSILSSMNDLQNRTEMVVNKWITEYKASAVSASKTSEAGAVETNSSEEKSLQKVSIVMKQEVPTSEQEKKEEKESTDTLKNEASEEVKSHCENVALLKHDNNLNSEDSGVTTKVFKAKRSNLNSPYEASISLLQNKDIKKGEIFTQDLLTANADDLSSLPDEIMNSDSTDVSKESQHNQEEIVSLESVKCEFDNSETNQVCDKVQQAMSFSGEEMEVVEKEFERIQVTGEKNGEALGGRGKNDGRKEVEVNTFERVTEGSVGAGITESENNGNEVIEENGCDSLKAEKYECEESEKQGNLATSVSKEAESINNGKRGIDTEVESILSKLINFKIADRNESSVKPQDEGNISQMYQPQITSLSLNGHIFKDKQSCLQGFSQFLKINSDLTQLKIYGGLNCQQVSDEVLELVGRYCPHLHSLVLEGCDRITDTGIYHLRVLKDLTSVDFTGLAFIGDMGIIVLTQDHLLTRMLLAESQCTELALKTMASRPIAKSLKDLDLSWCEDIDMDDPLSALVESCSSLERLMLRSCPLSAVTLSLIAENCRNLTELSIASNMNIVLDESVILLSENLPLLEIIDLGWNTHLTNDSICALMSNCPNLVIAHLEGLKQITAVPFKNIIAVPDEFQQYIRDLLDHCTDIFLNVEEALNRAKSVELSELPCLPHRSTTYCTALQELHLNYSDLVEDKWLDQIVAVTQDSIKVVNYYGEYVQERPELVLDFVKNFIEAELIL